MSGQPTFSWLTLQSDRAPEPSGDSPTGWVQPTTRHNLPGPLTTFMGRDKEIRALVALLSGAAPRLVTLTGPGGSGKTRLSLEVARSLLNVPHVFPDGVFVVDLAPISNPALVMSATAQVLGVPEDEAGSDGGPGKRLQEYLLDRRLLLLLDNFEQVWFAGPQVTKLLTSAHGLKVLVTSRRVLEVEGEYEWSVPSLPQPAIQEPLQQLRQSPAIDLFVTRARAARTDFELTQENALAVVEICNRLDRLPLAIELAAAWIKRTTPQAMLRSSTNPLDMARGGRRNVVQRLQSMRDAINWSYELLEVEEQRMFTRLAVFAGDFSLTAAEKICAERRMTASSTALSTLCRCQPAGDAT